MVFRFICQIRDKIQGSLNGRRHDRSYSQEYGQRTVASKEGKALHNSATRVVL